ncbi:MAG: hypothetical protein ACP5F6_08490 [Microbacter sp.]
MEQTGFNSFLVYFDIKEGIPLTPERYKIYQPKFKHKDEIEDIESNSLIAAESFSIQLNNYTKIKKYIWWLSVSYADRSPQSNIRKIKNLIKVTLRLREKPTNHFNFSIQDCINLCGSKYAYQFLEKRGIKNVKYLIEPISKPFLETPTNNHYERNNIILYNPAKPSKTMKKLLDHNKFNFKLLQGYNTSELSELYQKAKLYIDFGLFGGPERMPKEAVYFGCTILVGKRNAAKNNYDVAIPNKYKIKKIDDLQKIEKRINYMLNHYDQNIDDFKPFQNQIRNLENNFIQQIAKIFT